MNLIIEGLLLADSGDTRVVGAKFGLGSEAEMAVLKVQSPLLGAKQNSDSPEFRHLSLRLSAKSGMTNEARHSNSRLPQACYAAFFTPPTGISVE